MQDKAYIIEIATYKKGKLTDESGFIPQCYMSKDLVAKAVRRKSKKIFDSLPKALKPRIQVSYNDEAICFCKVSYMSLLMQSYGKSSDWQNDKAAF